MEKKKTRKKENTFRNRGTHSVCCVPTRVQCYYDGVHGGIIRSYIVLYYIVQSALSVVMFERGLIRRSRSGTRTKTAPKRQTENVLPTVFFLIFFFHTYFYDILCLRCGYEPAGNAKRLGTYTSTIYAVD